MKKIFTILILLIIAANLNAQAPQTMSYQAVIRDADNNLIVSQVVGMQVSILIGSATGDVVYSETLTPSTNANGLVVIEIGGETGLGSIDWSQGPYFIKIDTDPAGGTDYTISGTSELLAVPYAMHSLSAPPVTEADPLFQEWDKSEGILITESQISDLQDYVVAENLTITESQITDLQNYVVAENLTITESQITDLQDYLLAANFSYEGAQAGDILQFDGEKWVKTTLDFSPNEGTAAGQMQYWDGTAWVNISPGETGLTLTMCNGVPTWGTCEGSALVSINNITGITQETATVSAQVTSDGGNAITDRGVCWSTESSPTIEDNVVSDGGTGIGSYSVLITGLTAETTYYVRAYASNSAGTVYSTQRSFTAVELTFGSVTDIDNNEYTTVVIGNQEWMAGNLKTTKYADGTVIPNVTNNTDWAALSTGAYLVPDPSYGALYNWYAVEDPKGLCPAGWHVPSNEEYTQLSNYIINNFEFGGLSVGRALKSCRQVNSPLGGDCAVTAHPRWNEYGSDYGTDNFGFAALPGGARASEGSTSGIGSWGMWWTSTTSSDLVTEAVARELHLTVSTFNPNPQDKRRGLSIRCVKD